METYTPIKAERIKPLQDRILIDWEEKPAEFKIGGKTLVTPVQFAKQHYTGIVIDKGELVDDDIKPGDRIFFEQFSGFEKFWDDEYGRMALIREAAALAIIPKRVEVSTNEPGYNYDV